MKTNIVLLRIVILIFSLFNITQASVWYVHPDSIQNCIQDCLNACTTGDTVLVGPGTYYENIVWPGTHGINLVSEYGREMTIIDGDSAGSVIACTTGVDTTTVITGFTITKGYAEAGGGIHCYRSSPTISNCAIMNNSTIPGDRYGGGIYCRKSSPIIRDNIITSNKSDKYGGGISCDSASSAIIDGNAITGNTVEGMVSGAYGGGIYCYHSSSRIVNNSITENTALGGYSYGGGIDCEYSSTIVRKNSIKYNSSLAFGEARGGGISCNESSLIITDNLISENYVDGGMDAYGGGIYCSGDSSTVIVHNTISENIRSGICCHYSSPFIDSCTINGNNFDGVQCMRSDPQIHNCNIIDNDYYGVRSFTGGVTINAENNWWGDSTGPYHRIFNPGGLGDTVSDYVDFDPWLLIPVGLLEQSRPVVKPTLVQTTIVRGVLFLSPASSIERQASNILLDITGRKVADLKSGTNNIRHLAPGVYFIRRNINNQITKIIVTK